MACLGLTLLALQSPQPVKVQVYSSDKAIYLNSLTYTCSTEAATDTGTCDWESLFAADPDPLLKNISMNALVTKYVYSNNSTSSWCASFTFLRYPTYVFDTSPISNPLYLVTMTDNGPLTKSDEPLFVHPDWILMGWGVDKNGILSSEDVSVQYFQQDMASTETTFSFAHQSVFTQGLSLVPYTLVEASAPGTSISPQTSVLDVSVWYTSGPMA